MPRTVNEYFQPASTGVHNNIDNLILDAELDKLAQTGSMRADTRPQYIGGVDPIVENIAMGPLLTLKSLGSVGKKLLEKTGLRNPVSHYTFGQNASNILKQGKIQGSLQYPGRAVSVTRDPMFSNRPHGSIGTDVRFILDRDELVKKGFPMKPIAVSNYKKTLNNYGRPPITLENYKKIHGYYPDQMNPRFEFEERVMRNIPIENVKLIDILQLPLGEPDFSPNMLKLLGQLSRTNIPIIKSNLVKNRLNKMPIGKVDTFSDVYKLMDTPTYKTNPFKVSDYYSF
tara:strand:+ start:70 stop:924 length:855 start_codon:yes stop_codon:yes gene_type:complete